MNTQREPATGHTVKNTWLYQVRTLGDRPLKVYKVCEEPWDTVPQMALTLKPEHFDDVLSLKNPKLLIDVSGWISQLGPVADSDTKIRFRFSIGGGVPMEWRVPPGDPNCPQPVHGHVIVQKDVPKDDKGYEVMFQHCITSEKPGVVSIPGQRQLVVEARFIDA